MPAPLVMNKIICLDLDGIITDIGSQVKTYLEIDNINVDSDIVGDLLLTPDGIEYLEYIFEDPLFWKNLLPIKESWHCINDWFSNNFDVIFITARRSSVSQNEIEPWLEGWRVEYSDVIICDMYCKHEIVKKINPLIFIDDNPREVSKVSLMTESNVAVMKTWYNSHLLQDMKYVDLLTELKIG